MAETRTLRRLLVVDDNVDQSRALSIILRRRGYEVQFLDNGKQAIEFVSTHPVDLILLDVMMPDMTGLEVLRTLRSNRGLNAVRVCMYSAVDDPRWRDEARRLGAQGYLIKGRLDLDVLLGQIEDCLATPA